MVRAVELLLTDLRHAARRLRKAPAFVIVSTVLIAVSLASSTIIFGIVDVLLLRNLPIRDPARLVQLFELRPAIPPQEYLDVELRDLIAAQSNTLTDVMGEFNVMASLEREDSTLSVDVGLVTANYFEGLGVAAAIGRTLAAEDDRAGTRTAVLSHRAWRRLFARDSSVIGRTVRLAGQPYSIVGVLPEGFAGTYLDGAPDLRVHFANRADFGELFPYTSRHIRILARLRGGQSLESANAETHALWSRFREAFVAGGGVVGPLDRGLTVELRSIVRGTSRLRDQLQPTLLLLFGSAWLLLAMVCLNVGGLLLARITQARGEAATRLALGASRARIACQWIVESVMVAGIGGLLGIVLAGLAMPASIRWLSPLLSFGALGRSSTLEVTFDLRIAAFGAAATLATGILAAVGPTLLTRRYWGYETLKASTGDRETSRIQYAIGVVQVAISTVLLLGCGLLIHSLDRLSAVDTGFDRDLLVRFAIDARLAGYEASTSAALQRRLLEEIARLPGVQAVAITSTPVMQGVGQVMAVSPPGDPPEIDGSWNTNVNRVTAGYFATMGIELRSGTLFDDEAAADGPTPVVVNEAFARRFFTDEDAVGRVFDIGPTFRAPSYRILGIVADANYRSLRELEPPIFYLNPLSRPDQPTGDFSLLVRSTTPDALVGPVRALVRSVDAGLPMREAVTMLDEVERSLWRERLAAALTGAFATIGLAIAAMGLYALLAQYVASRRKEIGLRVALGAMGRDVLWLIVRRVVPMVLLGAALGTTGHLVLSRWAASLLYEVSMLDPLAVVAAGAALLVMALLAAAMPLLHAVSVDPATTLRDN